MKLTTKQSTVRMLTKDDKAFTIKDKSSMIIWQRAGIQISDDTPNDIREVLILAVQRGWVKPVAYMKESELMLFGLTKDY